MISAWLNDLLQNITGYRLSAPAQLDELCMDPEIVRTIQKVWSRDPRETLTMTSPERLNALTKAVEYIVEFDIEGAIVECGVWRGGSMAAAADTLLRLNVRDRDLYLFDTFEGMPPPTGADRDFRSSKASDLLDQSDKSSFIWAVSQIEEVQANLAKSRYPQERLYFIKGRVEETVPSQAPEKIALLRLDTDWYESTSHEMKHLFPLISHGGVLIVDDYGHWNGARKAVDEFVKETRTPLLLNRIDYTGRIAVKY